MQITGCPRQETQYVNNAMVWYGTIKKNVDKFLLANLLVSLLLHSVLVVRIVLPPCPVMMKEEEQMLLLVRPTLEITCSFFD